MKINAKILLAITPLLLITGCSMNEPTQQLIKTDNTNHIVGEKKNSIKTITYIQEKNGKLDTKVTFYIDKFPYKKEFNLCKNIKLSDCKGFLALTKWHDGDLFGSFSIKTQKDPKISLYNAFFIGKEKTYYHYEDSYQWK